MPASFVAANSQRISLGINQPYLVNCSGCTVSAWIYVTDLSVERSIVAISIGAAGPTGTSRLGLIVKPNGALFLINRASDADVGHECWGAAGGIALNTWYYVVGAVDYVVGAQAVFINGVASGWMLGVAFNQTTTPNTNAYNSAIGAEDNGSGSHWSGYIHDVRIWSRVLSLEEIVTIYTSGGKDSIIYKQDGRFLLSEGSSGTTMASAPNWGTVRTAGTPVNSPTYTSGVIEIQ